MITTELQTCLPNATIHVSQPPSALASHPLEAVSNQTLEEHFWQSRNLRFEVADPMDGAMCSVSRLGYTDGGMNMVAYMPSVLDLNSPNCHFSPTAGYLPMAQLLPPPPPPPLDMPQIDCTTPLSLNSFLPPSSAPSHTPGQSRAPGCFSSVFGDVFAGATTSDVEKLLREAQPEAYED
jgi:hypothetical protein